MKAKCRICGAQLDTKTAYKVITYDTNGKEHRAYYCSKEEYDANESRKKKEAADKDRVYKLVCEIIGRKEIINSILWKEKAIWNKVCADDVIAAYLEENRDYLKSVIARLDNIEFNRIRYLSAILKNKLGDFKPKVEVSPQVSFSPSIEDHYETKYKSKNRTSLDDIEEEYDD